MSCLPVKIQEQSPNLIEMSGCVGEIVFNPLTQRHNAIFIMLAEIFPKRVFEVLDQFRVCLAENDETLDDVSDLSVPIPKHIGPDVLFITAQSRSVLSKDAPDANGSQQFGVCQMPGNFHNRPSGFIRPPDCILRRQALD